MSFEQLIETVQTMKAADIRDHLAKRALEDKALRAILRSVAARERAQRQRQKIGVA